MLTHPESPPRPRGKRPWHVAMIPWLIPLSALGGFAGLLIGNSMNEYRSPDRRVKQLQEILEIPHRAAERFDTVIVPATTRALEGAGVEPASMVFWSPYGADTGDLETWRGFVENDYGQPGAALAALLFEWDDAVIAALNTEGTEVRQPEMLAAALDAGYSERIYAAEEEFIADATRWIDDLERSERIREWIRQALPWIVLALLAVVPTLLFIRYSFWMDRHDEAEGGWRNAAPLVPALAAGPSGAGEGEVADDQADAGGAHGQPVHVAAHLDDVEEHPLEGGGDGELP